MPGVVPQYWMESIRDVVAMDSLMGVLIWDEGG